MGSGLSVPAKEEVDLLTVDEYTQQVSQLARHFYHFLRVSVATTDAISSASGGGDEDMRATAHRASPAAAAGERLNAPRETALPKHELLGVNAFTSHHTSVLCVRVHAPSPRQSHSREGVRAEPRVEAG